jgi:hypothetical protein
MVDEKIRSSMRGSPELLISRFLGKTVQKALPPSLFAELSQFEVVHANVHSFAAPWCAH